jgi:hypothetical protein
VDLKEIGITQKCKVQNLWENQQFSQNEASTKVKLKPNESILLKMMI